MKLFAAVILACMPSFFQCVLPINITIISSPSEAATKHVVWMRCCLEPGDVALFQKGLAVHTDNRALRIASWHVDAIPTLLPPQIFHRARRAYTETVFFSVTLQSSLTGTALHEALAHATFYVAGLALKRSVAMRWSIQPVLTMACMTRINNANGLAGLELLQPTQADSDVGGVTPAVLWQTTKPLNEEFTWIDAFAHVWNQLLIIGAWLNNVYALLFFFLLMIGCFLKRYTPFHYALVPCRGLTLQWLHLASIVGFCVLFLCNSIPWIGVPLTCLLVSIIFMMSEAYAFVFQPTEKILLGRLTAVVGWLMGASVLPCLAKGILSWYGW